MSWIIFKFLKFNYRLSRRVLYLLTFIIVHLKNLTNYTVARGALPNDIFAQRSTMLKIVHVITQSDYAFFLKQKTHLI